MVNSITGQLLAGSLSRESYQDRSSKETQTCPSKRLFMCKFGLSEHSREGRRRVHRDHHNGPVMSRDNLVTYKNWFETNCVGACPFHPIPILEKRKLCKSQVILCTHVVETVAKFQSFRTWIQSVWANHIVTLDDGQTSWFQFAQAKEGMLLHRTVLLYHTQTCFGNPQVLLDLFWLCFQQEKCNM